MVHIVWYSENIEEEMPQFYSESKLNKNVQFGAVPYIYMDKKYDKMLIPFNVIQWDFYNSIT